MRIFDLFAAPFGRFFALLLGILLLIGTSYPAQADVKPTVNIAVGFSLQPYVFKSGRGIIGDIVRNALNAEGYTVNFSFFSNAEALERFNQREFDAVAVVKPGMVDAYFSEPFITFSNRLISLASSSEKYAALAALHGKRVVGFSNARRYLGEDFNAAINTADYHEESSQLTQARDLLTGKVDVIVADKNIFEYYRKRLINSEPFNSQFRQQVQYGYQFPDSVYHAAFHSQDLQQAFDRGYLRLLKRGHITEVFDLYLDLLKVY